MKSASRMPCRSGGELFSFDQDDIGPTQLGQMIEHCGADDTTANYDYSGMFFHISEPKFSECQAYVKS